MAIIDIKITANSQPLCTTIHYCFIRDLINGTNFNCTSNSQGEKCYLRRFKSVTMVITLMTHYCPSHMRGY